MLNSNLRYQVQHIGNEQQTLLIIDDLVSDPRGLIDYACQRGEVVPAAGHYPGLRSPTPAAYANMLCTQLADLLTHTFALKPNQISQADCFYSLVTTPPQALSIVQQLPHFDQALPDNLAIIHYLCAEEHGGTSFYRHKQSGYEYIDESRKTEYLSALNQQLEQQGLPQPPRYIDRENLYFVPIFRVAAKFNRAVIYRCSSLHSGDIGEDYSFDTNPYTGRFTIASFLHS
jgi:hypothetical protein